MVDVVLTHSPALSRAKSGSFGAVSTAGRIALTALPEGHVLQVLARGGATGLDASLSEIGDGGAFAIRAFAPGQWFLIGDAALSSAEIASKSAALSGRASISDQSHGRVRMAIGGASVEAVLAKGTAVDLDAAKFAIGTSAMTLIGHITALLTRTDMDRFEILVLRGFAESLWDDLIQMSLEFGVDAHGTV